MYHALLVDDEAHSVRGLQAGVCWDELNISKVYTAYNLRQAMEVFEKSAIDLMICDIEMPQGSGLELLAWVREHHPWTETVFLTCHSDFTYTKKAIQLSSFDYLLKPVDFAELESSMVKVLEKIRTDREHRQFEDQLKRYASLWEAYQPLRKELFWKDVVEQTIPSSPDNINEHAARYQLVYQDAMTFLPVYIQIRRWNKQLTQREKKIMEYALRNAAEEKLCEGNPEAAIVPVGAYALLVVLPLRPGGSTAGLHLACRNYIESCNRYFGCDLCIYIGSPTVPHAMAGMLRMLQQANRDNVTMESGTHLLEKLKMCKETVEPLPVLEWAERMKQGEKEKLLADVAAYFDRMEGRGAVLGAASLHRIYHDFLQVVFYVLQMKGLNASDVFSENLLIDKPQEVLKSIHDFREWAKYVIEVAVSHLHSLEVSLSVVERVQRFIMENLGEPDLTRKEIANRFYLNPDYLTRLFKKETGMSVSDFLHDQRIEYAKILLERSDQSISNIAMASGYGNSSHFSTAFKNATKQSPIDYRRFHRK
ncbi:response regulator [Paenibacillus alginolyticus]|uniref:Response regulator n=1 Tax=Paenibacillus alginolyticus TaxID=59839 RepID=A0ABT4GAE7_9BACL|nr:helix-turn-helix domain-containing protein [Paenibacillus alginolyticus]MCY9693166.1 response regulator [Paenibacillus alginolyticus]MEC0144539.1 response regulator [Paenibacillus alginolyticus]